MFDTIFSDQLLQNCHCVINLITINVMLVYSDNIHMPLLVYDYTLSTLLINSKMFS